MERKGAFCSGGGPAEGRGRGGGGGRAGARPLTCPRRPRPPRRAAAAACLRSAYPERKFLSVFVNDKLINDSSTQPVPAGPSPRQQPLPRAPIGCARRMYPLRRPAVVPIEEPPGAARGRGRGALRAGNGQRRYRYRYRYRRGVSALSRCGEGWWEAPVNWLSFTPGRREKPKGSGCSGD